MAGERTERASPQRREKARRDGDVLHSRELCAAAGTLAGVMLLGVTMPRFIDRWMTALGGFQSYGGSSRWEPAAVNTTLHSLLGLTLMVLAPAGLVGAGVAIAALAAGVVQTGGIQVHPQMLALRMDRINPANNIKNLFSLRAVARLGKSLIPAALLGIFAVQRLTRQWSMPVFSSSRLMNMGEDAYDLLLAAAWLLFAWAAVDYLVERHSREQRLKMSRQEQREEFKESEGNPQIRGRIRNLQRLVRRRRMQADVARAAIVITNPTHYAVALDFDFETMDAPTVLAKGQNLIAEEIKSHARWAGVPILENPPLARSLYRLAEPGESIPVELYAAVASILAFLYRLRVEEEMRQRRERNARNSAVTEAHGGTQPSAAQAPAVAVIPGLRTLGRYRRGRGNRQQSTAQGSSGVHKPDLPQTPDSGGTS